MKITFWGTRGSLPAPGPDTLRYGGNTTCLEVITDDDERIILDAGSGIQRLGQSILGEMPLTCSIFLTHAHWDHMHGFPFFVPAFVPGNDITVYGGYDPVSMQGIKDILSVQMNYPFFPVRTAELKSKITYRTLTEEETVTIGSTRITPLLMNHTCFTFGYRIVSGDKSLFFSADHEPYSNIYSPEDPDYKDYQKAVDERNKHLVSFIRGVDVLIADSQYTEEEYRQRVGWGHSTYDQNIELAAQAECKALYLTHHDINRTDDALDAIGKDLAERYPDEPFSIQLAREGHQIEL